MKVATNVASLNTQRWLGVSGAGQSKALERLSSGYKINKAADDAAGIAIALKLNVKAASVSKAIDNGNQAIAMLQTAESGVEQIGNILTRMKELATQAASDNNQTDIASLEAERAKLETEIGKIAQNTKYGSVGLLTGTATLTNTDALGPADGVSTMDVASGRAGAYSVTYTHASTTFVLTNTTDGTSQTVVVPGGEPTGLDTTEVNFSSFGIKFTVNSQLDGDLAAHTFTVTAGSSSFDFQLGAENVINDQINVSIGDFQVNGTGVLQDINGGDISTKANAKLYLTNVDNAIADLNTERGKIGAAQNQIGYHIANLDAAYENTKSAESIIKDADYATEMANFTKFQIINQAGIAMLAQANQLPQQIMTLLRG
jgi:flagellin